MKNDVSYIDRMIEQVECLASKVEGLADMMNSKKFESFDLDTTGLMYQQMNVMQNYIEILENRISHASFIEGEDNEDISELEKVVEFLTKEKKEVIADKNSTKTTMPLKKYIKYIMNKAEHEGVYMGVIVFKDRNEFSVNGDYAGDVNATSKLKKWLIKKYSVLMLREDQNGSFNCIARNKEAK